jgi:regulator of replication initiation timing
VVKASLVQKDEELKKTTDALAQLENARDEALRAVNGIQEEKDLALKEIESLRLQLKQLKEEKAKLVKVDLDRAKALKTQALNFESLKGQYDELADLITKHCQLFFGMPLAKSFMYLPFTCCDEWFYWASPRACSSEILPLLDSNQLPCSALIR